MDHLPLPKELVSSASQKHILLTELVVLIKIFTLIFLCYYLLCRHLGICTQNYSSSLINQSMSPHNKVLKEMKCKQSDKKTFLFQLL